MPFKDETVPLTPIGEMQRELSNGTSARKLPCYLAATDKRKRCALSVALSHQLGGADCAAYPIERRPMASMTTRQNTYDRRRATLSMRHDGKYLIAIDRVAQA